MSEHYSNQYKMHLFCVRKLLIILVQLVLLSSYSSLIWFCEAHAPLHRIYYGPHRFNPSLSSSSSASPSSASPSSASSLISSLASSPSSSPTIDPSSFGNRFIDSQSSSSEPNQDRSENDILYSQLANSFHSIPSCNQLKYLWKEANRLAINLYGPDFAFSHPKLHANPFYLTNLLLKKHHHNHLFGGSFDNTGGDGIVDVSSVSGSDKGAESISPFHPVLVRPAFGTFADNSGKNNVKGSNNIYSEIGEFGSIQDRLGSSSSNSEGFNLKELPVPGQFADYSIPKNHLGAIYGSILMSPDQLHHSSPTSSSSSSSISSSTSSKQQQLVKSSLQASPPSSSSSTPLPSSSRKDAKHKPIGFGEIISNSKETYDSSPDEPSHRSPESSKKVDNFFNLGFWHDTPIDLS